MTTVEATLSAKEAPPRPPFAAVMRLLWPLACLLAGAGAWLAGGPADQDLFAGLGNALLHGHVGAVYANPENQAGPLQLLAAVGLKRADLLLGSERLVRSLISIAIVVSVRAVVRRVRDVHPAREATVALMTALVSAPGGPWDGHPAELFIPAAWVFSAVQVRRGRWGLAGIGLGLSALVAPWGLLAAPVVLLGRVRDSVRAAMLAAGVVAAVYLPFVVSGHFAMPQFVWRVSTESLLHLVAPRATVFGWWARLGQAVVITAGGIAVALRAGRAGVVLVPFAVAVLRVLTDPASFSYYWVPVSVIGALAPLIVGPRCARPRWYVFALAYLPLLGTALAGSFGYAALGCGTVALTALGFAVLSVGCRREQADRALA